MRKIIIASSILRVLGNQSTLFGRGTVTAFPARTSEEILDLHGTHQADVIITEENLPQMGGAKLCAAIRSDEALKRVSIIMVCDSRDEGRAARIQANAILAAPADPVEIFSKVSELLIIPQRKDLRVLLRATVKVKNQESSFFGMCHNISISGMLFDTDRQMKAGDEFSCSFRVANREITVLCRVVRATAARGRCTCAVTFLNMDTKSLIIVEQYVKHQIRH